MSQMVLLSVLVPTYNYPEGLERILSALSCSSDEVEILVFDDSPSMDLKRVIDNFSSVIPGLRYRHNSSVLGGSLGAARNWNSLLDAAKGMYVVLMHHDEFPQDLSFTSTLYPILRGEGAPDVIMLDLLLLDEFLQPLPRHVPRRLRWLITQYVPGYLFRRNVIGPTATLIVRKSLMPRFDPALRWLIDVDFYVKLCRSGFRWANAQSIQIGSVQRKSGTITNELASELSTIDRKERGYLSKEYPGDRVWLDRGLNAPLGFLECILWTSLKGGLIVLHSLSKFKKKKLFEYR
jgi:glycosyltransferase involved in cell wall biosynthesis